MSKTTFNNSSIPDTADGRYRKIDDEQTSANQDKQETQANQASDQDFDVEAIEQFLKKVEQSFAGNLPEGLSADQATMLAKMPAHIRQLVVQFSEAKRAKEDAKKETNPLRQQEKLKEAEQKLQKVAQETLTVACASTLPIDEVLKFHEKCNLGVKGINEFGDTGLNPLTAAMAGNRDLADLEKILGKGADINFKSPEGNTPAHFAVMLGVDSKMMNFLVGKGLDLNVKNAFGLTPLDMAALKGDEKMIKLLVDKGAQLNMVKKLPAEKDQTKEEGKGREKSAEEKAKFDKKLKLEGKEQKEQKEKELKELKEAQEKAAREAIERAQAGMMKTAQEALNDHETLMAKIRKDKIKDQTKTAAAEKTKEQKLLEQLTGVDSEKIDINKLLFQAASSGRELLADFLISIGANVNYKEGGVSVLDAAIFSGNKSLIEVVAVRAAPDALSLALKNPALDRIEGMKEFLEHVIPAAKAMEAARATAEKTAEKPVEKAAEKVAEKKPETAAEAATEKSAAKVDIVSDILSDIAGVATTLIKVANQIALQPTLDKVAQGIKEGLSQDSAEEDSAISDKPKKRAEASANVAVKTQKPAQKQDENKEVPSTSPSPTGALHLAQHNHQLQH